VRERTPRLSEELPRLDTTACGKCAQAGLESMSGKPAWSARSMSCARFIARVCAVTDASGPGALRGGVRSGGVTACGHEFVVIGERRGSAESGWLLVSASTSESEMPRDEKRPRSFGDRCGSDPSTFMSTVVSALGTKGVACGATRGPSSS